MSIFIGQQCASLLTPRSSQMCLLFLVRPTRGRSMGDVLSPSRSGYALRLGAMIRLTSCGGHKRCVSAIWILRITSSAEVTNDVYPQYGSFVSPPPAEVTNDVYPQYRSFVSPPAEVTNDVYPQYRSFVSPPLRRSQTMCICNMDPSYHLLCGGHKRCVSAIWILRITTSAEVTTDDNDVSLSGLGRNDRSAVGRILAPSRRA